MLEYLPIILAGIILGIIAGIITGLTPGVHINLVSAILLSLAPAIALHAPLYAICALIMAMAITHTFIDTIPSIFLGAPDDDKALGVLPGHRYLLRGNGLMAVKLCVVGGIIGSVTAAVLFLPLQWLITALYTYARPFLFWVLLAIVAFTVVKDRKRMWALLVFMLSGTFGLIVLRLPLKDPLLPLLSGMFGIATLLYSINENQAMPPQRDECYTQLDAAKTILGGACGIVAGILTALLPGISASAAASASSQGAKLGDHGFLILLGALGSAGFTLSLAAYLGIEKARNGAMAVIVMLSQIDGTMTLVLVSVSLIATGVATLLTLRLGRSAAWLLPRLPYRQTCIAVIAFVALLVMLRAGGLGLVVLATSTTVGLLPAALKTARAQAMGCLLLPTLFYLY
jgi:putative membrane protein